MVWDPNTASDVLKSTPVMTLGLTPVMKKHKLYIEGQGATLPGGLGVPDRNKEMKHWRRATKSLGTEKQKETAKN